MKEKRFGMIVGSAAAVFCLLFAAGGGKAFARTEGGHAPEDMHLQGPALQGSLTAEYVPVDWVTETCTNEPFGCARISYTVKCKNARGVTYSVQMDLQKYITEYTEVDLDGLILLNAGPQGCASPAGGEDLVVKQVFRFSNDTATGGNISADMFLLYAVPYSPNNPIQ